MTFEDNIEEVLKPQLQKNLEFELNGKIYKRGKFLLYTLETYNNNYEITFKFEKDGDRVENFKVPYPFLYEYYPDDQTLFFDYRVFTLANNDGNLAQALKSVSKKYTPSKYFDKILKINCKIF